MRYSEVLLDFLVKKFVSKCFFSMNILLRGLQIKIIKAYLCIHCNNIYGQCSITITEDLELKIKCI